MYVFALLNVSASQKFKFVCFSNGKFEIFPEEKLITFVKQDVNYKIVCTNIKLQ